MPEISAMPPPEKKRSLLVTLLRPKVAVPMSLVLLLLLSPLIIRGWSLRGVPDIPEPFDAQPLLSLEVPDAENAFLEYRQATALYIDPSSHVSELRDGGTSDVPVGINDEGWHLADDAVKQFLHDNENALLTWKQGTAKEKAQQILARDYDFETILAVSYRLREFLRTVMLLGRKLEAEGQYEKAWEWYRASVRASRHNGTNGCLIERLTGIQCFYMTAERLEDWSAQPRVSRELLQRAVQELQTDWKLTEKNSTIWKIEYLMILKTIAKCESGQFDWSILEGKTLWDLPVNNFTLYLMGETKLGKRLTRILTENQLRYCDLMPYERPVVSRSVAGLYETGNLSEINPDEFDRALKRSYIAETSLSSMSKLQQTFDREEIKYRTLLVMLAGQAFYREHERFPHTLNELVPDHLASIPVDIYDGTPLKYRFDPVAPVVYSVFENRTDDGGVEWTMDQISGTGKYPTDDFGFQLRIPSINPLRAEKPADGVETEGYLEYGGSDVDAP